MLNKRRKSVVDDGCSPELVRGADFDGIFEIPIIKKPNQFIIPKNIVPFSQREKAPIFADTAIGFNEMDPRFANVLINPEKYLADIGRFGILISPDCSLYRDAPLAVQITNVYRNRAIGYYYQSKGQYVIPQVRWGNEETYTTKVLPDKIAFLGAEKHSILSIGTYGCCQSRADKYYFKAGLDAMLETLEPKVVLVYGSMSDSIFGDYVHTTHFIQYDDWTTLRHGGES